MISTKALSLNTVRKPLTSGTAAEKLTCRQDLSNCGSILNIVGFWH